MTIYTGVAPASMYADFLLDLSIRDQDLSANTTTLSYRIYLKSKSGGYPFSSAQHKIDFTANGRTIVNTTTSYKVPAGGEFTLASGTFTVVHNSDGTKKFNFSSAFASYHGNCSVSGEMTLPTISRGATLSVDSTSADIGTTLRFTMNGTSSNFTYQIRYSLTIDSGSLSGLVSGTSFTLPTSWISNYFKNESSKQVIFSLLTYNGSTIVAEDKISITVKVPSNITPSITNVKVEENNPTVTNILGTGFYQNLSTYKITVTAVGNSGSTITNYEVENVISKDNILYLPKISQFGTIPITVKVTDSRGRIAKLNQSISVLPFSLPTISRFVPTRNSDGGSAEVRLVASHTAVGDPDKNPARIVVRIKKTTEITWETKYDATSRENNFDQVIVISNNLDSFEGYDVEATITDNFSSNKVVATIPTSDITMAFNVRYNSIGIGLFPNMFGRDNLEVKGDVNAHGKIFGSGTITNPKTLGRTDDLNTTIEAGYYTTFRPINGPSDAGSSATVIVTKSDMTTGYDTFSDTIQIYIDNYNAIYIRNSVDKTNTWTAWVKVGDGAGPEIINYSTGYTIKYPDGIMEQVIEYNLSSTEKNFTSGSTGFYGAKTVTVYFHEPFYLAPAAVANCHSSGYINGFIGETYTNRTTIRLYSPNSVSASGLSTARVTVIAKGRWK